MIQEVDWETTISLDSNHKMASLVDWIILQQVQIRLKSKIHKGKRKFAKNI